MTKPDNIEQEPNWDAVRPELEKAWAAVLEVVNSVISYHDRFGFELIEKHIDPSLSDILRALKVLEAMLNAIQTENHLEYDMFRLVVNAKQQIVHFEFVVNALKHNRQEDYEAAMVNLRTQVQF